MDQMDQEQYVVRAGRCEIDHTVSPPRVRCLPDRGQLTFEIGDDGLLRLTWRKDDSDINNPELDYVLFPGDAIFRPYRKAPADIQGRFYILKFPSGSGKQLFWLQTPAANPAEPSVFSPRDLEHEEIVSNMMNVQGGAY